MKQHRVFRTVGQKMIEAGATPGHVTRRAAPGSLAAAPGLGRTSVAVGVRLPNGRVIVGSRKRMATVKGVFMDTAFVGRRRDLR